MRSMFTLVAIFIFILSPVVRAQQSSGTTGDKAVGDAIGHPPPLPGPPPVPSPPPLSGATPDPQLSPTPKSAPAVTTDRSLEKPADGTGADKVAADGVSTRRVKALPCGVVARETDGFTTCVGITNERSNPEKRQRRLN
jgi:hypothetical protein